MERAADRAFAESHSSLFERRVTAPQLRIFKIVADNQSFSRVAPQLHLSQPAVSHQVGTVRGDRRARVAEIGRRTQLTETGRLLYEHAGRILSEFEVAGRAVDEHHVWVRT